MKPTIAMKRILFVILFALASLTSQAQEEEFIKGYTGGMMVHAGYLNGCDNPFGYEVDGLTIGIGGLLKFHLTEHFRIGTEGYVSTVGLREGVAEGSYNKLFWAGALCDWYWKWGRFYPYIGATVGGGVETSYYMFEGSGKDWEPEANAVFHKEPVFVIDPFMGVDYELKHSMRLTLRFDYLVSFNSFGANHPSGPRLYFGFVFAN